MGFARRQFNEAGPQRTRTLSVAGFRQGERRLSSNSCQYRALSPQRSAYYSRVCRCFFSRDLDPTRALDTLWRGLLRLGAEEGLAKPCKQSESSTRSVLSVSTPKMEVFCASNLAPHCPRGSMCFSTLAASRP